MSNRKTNTHTKSIKTSHLSLIQWSTDSKQNGCSKTKEQFIKDLEKIIRDNIENKQFSVTDLAKHMYMGRGNLYRLVKSLTGLSPNYIIQKARLNLSFFLLKNSNLRVNEVADKVGYTDKAYFSRAFRKHYGYPPSQARVL